MMLGPIFFTLPSGAAAKHFLGTYGAIGNARALARTGKLVGARVVVPEINLDALWTFGAEWLEDIALHHRIAAMFRARKA